MTTLGMLPRRTTLALAAALPFALPAQAEDDIMPRGAPRGRIGGSTRGPEAAVEGLSLDLVAPLSREAVDVMDPQPSLFFTATRAAPLPVRFALAARGVSEPLALQPLPPLSGPGLVEIRLGALGVRLPPGILLLWSVSVLVDEANPSADLVAVGLIRHRLPPGALATQLAGPPGARRAALLAAGYWYDAAAEAARAPDGGAAFRELMRAEGIVLPT